MKADNINETTLTRKARPVGGDLYILKTQAKACGYKYVVTSLRLHENGEG